MRTHFFTGFPGFIASELIKEILRQGEVKKIYLLIQKEQVVLAKSKIKSIMEEVQVIVPFELIVGDISKPSLSIEQSVIQQLNTEHLTVWHLAAIYDLAVQAEIAWKVNVDGTRYVNEFVKHHPSIERYMYFSTAYVAGKREGLLLETELIRPTAFKNHYEETKFEAEILVESLKTHIPLTIIRPGIVRGHSITGETIKFDGPYFFMNMIDRLKWLPFIPYVGKTEACINVVPIDYIINATVYLSKSPEAVGETIHLTDPAPHPIEDVYRAMVIELTGKKPKGRLPRILAEKGLSSTKLQQKLGVEVETIDYLTWNATFDTTIAQQLLAPSGIKCADFIQSIPTMTAFYNKNKGNPEFHIKIN
ncbi:SDR family oxidoreductase [Sporosarcina ureilytica]|uniref:3-beta hydroxysteroid dehydrogenase n=1 Tax=Sporosarcina ureilytica TaxID=298596 RepID=A0A1D8JI69_9BACL|nr:SDR family oxidoreductase [Sporosarcina ureilytica]AOV08420.1 3-beta hydroxysteroid dehydrogenase [Sporosarcina ureilytica]